MIDYELLRLIWWGLIGVLLIGFAITDGFDMGVAALLPFLGKTDTERRIMINTVAPHWDGNQVWLVTAGGAIFAAWPQVYATAFSGFYIAMILTLVVLWLRPLAFDYRSKLEDPRWRNLWDWGLFASGIVPPVIFGVAFGNLIQGVPFCFDDLMRVHYEGSFFALLNPFALLCALMAASLFITHGALWLKMKTRSRIEKRVEKVVYFGAFFTLVLFIIAGIWMHYIDGYLITSQIDRSAVSDPTLKTVVVKTGVWLTNFDKHHFMWIAPCLAVVGGIFCLMSIWLEKTAVAFLCSAVMIGSIILTAGFTLFPFVMPSSLLPDQGLTLWDATSSENTLFIMAVVACIFVPLVLLYTIWCYVKMSGRIDAQFIEENKHSVY